MDFYVIFSLLVEGLWSVFLFFCVAIAVVCYLLNYGTLVTKKLPWVILDLVRHVRWLALNEWKANLQILCGTDIFDYLSLFFRMKDPAIWTRQKWRYHVQRPIRGGQSDNLRGISQNCSSKFQNVHTSSISRLMPWVFTRFAARSDCLTTNKLGKKITWSRRLAWHPCRLQAEFLATISWTHRWRFWPAKAVFLLLFHRQTSRKKNQKDRMPSPASHTLLQLFEQCVVGVSHQRVYNIPPLTSSRRYHGQGWKEQICDFRARGRNVTIFRSHLQKTRTLLWISASSNFNNFSCGSNESRMTSGS